jgi:glycosyltransferase involved in cell wall biosynthesis
LAIDFIKAYQLKKDIQRYLINHSIPYTDCIFYAYWHDYKAVALAMLSSRDLIKSVVRAHGWDVDYPRHAIPYLPYKEFIVSNTTKSVCISEYGKERLEEVTSSKEVSKIEISKLGKMNSRACIFEKEKTNQIHICSCSSLIPLKRVDLIIEFLSHLHFESITWTHFGDGPLKASLEALAQSKLPHCKIDFKGNVPNGAILDFYHSHYIDLFVNMSSSEGIPVSIMEAQSAGIPVLATSVGGTPEIVNIENGFLVEKDFDIIDCAKEIGSFLLKPEEEIYAKRLASYNNWNKNFNAQKNYHNFAENILSL